MAEEEKGKKDNRKKEKVKAWWHFNRIELGFLVIIIVIVFGIAQPIIWCLLFGTYPPEGVIDIANLLLILITLLAIGLTGFSVLIYEFIRERLSTRITEVETKAHKHIEEVETKAHKHIEEVETKAHKHIEEHVDEVFNRHEELSEKTEKDAEIRQNLFRAQMLRSLGYTFWQLFSVWEDIKIKGKSTEDINIHTKKIYNDLIKLAIEKAKRSLDFAKELPQIEKYKEDIYKCRTNWMYFLAESVRVEDFEQDIPDKKLALKFSNEILEEIGEVDYLEYYYEFQESCAWVLQHLSEKEDEKSKQKAFDIIHKLIKDDDIPPSWREEYRIKWKNSWEQQGQKIHEDFKKNIEGA